jgi:hypothetical protein
VAYRSRGIFSLPSLNFQNARRFGLVWFGLARRQQCDRFGSRIAGALFVKVIGEIYKPFKHMQKVLF